MITSLKIASIVFKKEKNSDSRNVMERAKVQIKRELYNGETDSTSKNTKKITLFKP